MANLTSQRSPTEKYRRPISCSLFMSSPRLFTSFTSSKAFSETESVMSPTSILDSKPFSSYHLKNPFWSDPKPTPSSDPESTTTTKQQRPWDDKKAIGLGLVDALNDDKSDQKQPKPETRMVVFGSHLKIQIPYFFQADFGIKTRNSQPCRSPVEKSASGSPDSGRVFTDMELSEDYTCVITHGPNPKKTHIFDNCIVEESFFGVVGFSGASKDNINNNNNISDDNDNYNCKIFDTAFGSEDFLSVCCTCKKNLGQGKDIYMYRGEKAFCSNECRYEGMMLEEREDDKLGFDGV